jgi:hypothetical protein
MAELRNECEVLLENLSGDVSVDGRTIVTTIGPSCGTVP